MDHSCIGTCGCVVAGRRRVLSAGVASGALGMFGAWPAGQARAQTTLSPAAVLAELKAGNARFASGRSQAFKQDVGELLRRTENKQEPIAAVLGCADSRVPVELLFDQSIGQLFVTRVAGNVATPSIIASLEYGAKVLGVKVIAVMAHTHCGAVKAALANAAVPGQISGLYPYLHEAVRADGERGERAVAQRNALVQADVLRTASPLISQLVADGRLWIVPMIYDVAGGSVSILDA